MREVFPTLWQWKLNEKIPKVSKGKLNPVQRIWWEYRVGHLRVSCQTNGGRVATLAPHYSRLNEIHFVLFIYNFFFFVLVSILAALLYARTYFPSASLDTPIKIYIYMSTLLLFGQPEMLGGVFFGMQRNPSQRNPYLPSRRLELKGTKEA